MEFCCTKCRILNNITRISKICGFVLTFGAGIYAGIYISQNYEVPRVDDPQSLIQKFNNKIRELADEHRKKNAAEQLLHDVKKSAKKVLDD